MDKIMEDRHAGYRAGIMSAGEFIKSKVVGAISNGDIFIQKGADLEKPSLLLSISKEDLDSLARGELPKEIELCQDQLKKG